MRHTVNSIFWTCSALMIAGMVLLIIPLSIAQEYPEPELPAQAPPYQVYETEVTEVKRDKKTTATIVYDIYGRYIEISEKLPLGFTAETAYTWYPDNYLREERCEGCYESVIQKEEGRLLRNGTEYASYTRIFDEKGKRTKSESSGLRAILPLLKIIAQIIGQDIDETEIQDLL